MTENNYHSILNEKDYIRIEVSMAELENNILDTLHKIIPEESFTGIKFYIDDETSKLGFTLFNIVPLVYTGDYREDEAFMNMDIFTDEFYKSVNPNVKNVYVNSLDDVVDDSTPVEIILE